MTSPPPSGHGGPSLPAALTVEEVRKILHGLGTTDDEIDQAENEGTLPLLMVERVMLPGPARHDLAAVAERTGLSEDQIRHLWRSLGFAEPRPGEVVFTDVDVDVLTQVATLMDADIASPELIFQMSRVIGSSIARIASAHVDVIAARVSPADPNDVLTDDRIVAAAGSVLPLVPRVLEGTWRRHLHAAARRRLTQVLSGGEPTGAVGFADLVGFTALSQQIADDELAAVVEQFAELAFEVITAGGGRVVKMIGDEVMFTVDTPPAAAEVALGLAEVTREADELSDVRVGMAYGALLEREGDLFGPVVNLASRMTKIAFPGSILVSESMRDALVDAPDYVLRAMRPRHLKDIGRVPLWVLRRSSGAESRFAERRRALGAATRARVDASPPPFPSPRPPSPPRPPSRRRR